jgi:alpha-tubulin suppressor-like RCC1 family protein
MKIIQFKGKIFKIVAGDSQSAFVGEKGELYIWGGVHGLNPKRIIGSTVADIALGSTHLLALTLHGKILAYGTSKFGGLGISKNQFDEGMVIEVDKPIIMPIFCHRRIISISAGSFAITQFKLS